MALTKLDIVQGAYMDIGMDSNIEAIRLTQGLKTLDRMMAAWLNAGIDIGYLIGENSSLTDEVPILMQHVEAVQSGLAVKLARILAIPVDVTYLSASAKAYSDLFSIRSPSLARNPMMPMGAGNNWSSPYTNPYQQIEVGNNVDASDAHGIDVTDSDGFIITE